MTEFDSAQLVASELVALAQRRELDLTPLLKESLLFLTSDRFIYFWRVEEKIRYSCQGRSIVSPGGVSGSDTAAGSGYSETGILDNLEDALKLLKAWLLDGKEVGALPERHVTSYGRG
jgi:hypothetical protein